MREVTREVGRELENREADARLEALVNAMPFAVWGRSGANLTVTHQNAASIAMWGDTRGQALADAAPETREVWERQLADVMTGEVVRARREQVRDNERRVLEDIIAPVIVEDRVIGAVGVALDVTQEARAARLQTLLTEISADCASRSSDALDAGLVLALEKIAQFIGAPIAVLCEISDQDQLRLTHWWLHPSTGRDRPRFLEVDARHIRPLLQKVALNTPVVVRSRDQLPEGSDARNWLATIELQSFAIVPTRQLDGTVTLLALVGAFDQPVDWPSDTVSCMRVVSTLLGGVLARARAEANQRAVERRMQEAQRLESLGVLAGGIAHDFNNLLTAILGNASLLRAELDQSSGMVEAVGQIESASRRAAGLCRQMLAFAGRGRFSLQLTDLNELVRDMEALLQVTVPKKSTLTLALAPSIPVVLADEAQLRQLVMNLVINAAEALDANGGTITVQTASTHKTAEELSETVFSPQLSAGEYVSLTVTDTGTGMTPDTIARIFDPFFSTKFTGRGLGLAAVVGIVRAHKGALRVQTREGSGSTFELMLPAQQGSPEPPLEAASPASHAALTAWKTTGTALVVDDEPGVRELVRSVLERLGMTVEVAENGDLGVEAFRRLAADVRVVLVDFTMPGLDGREVLAAMRQVRADIPAILMSGYSPTDRLNTSSHEFLQKPFTPATLRAALRRALNE
jgi:signal transduction histidine kinase